MRSGFDSRKEIHDLAACSYTLTLRLGLSSRLMTLIFRSRLTTSDFILKTVLKLPRSKGRVHLMFRKLGCTGRAGEGESDVELGAGTVDTTGLVRRACLDLGTLNSCQTLID